MWSCRRVGYNMVMEPRKKPATNSTPSTMIGNQSKFHENVGMVGEREHYCYEKLLHYW